MEEIQVTNGRFIGIVGECERISSPFFVAFSGWLSTHHLSPALLGLRSQTHPYGS